MIFVIAFLENHSLNLYPGILHFLVILRPPPLLFMWSTCGALSILDVNFLLQHRLKVDWLSKSRTLHRSNSVSFQIDSCFRASTIFGWIALSNSKAPRKWLDTSSTVDIDEASNSSSSSSCCWSAIDFFNFLFSFSNALIVFERDLVEFADLKLETDLSSHSN